MVIGERGREVILIEAQFATVPLKSFRGTLEKYPCWPTAAQKSINLEDSGRGKKNHHVCCFLV